ncbi:hypothetical protein COO60DRAFT_1665217 [Scenedesmus sp. NREL 46B-D3]|nr:hypothetical protein COO60DRAFT_1665217 [Scenedesmus sp. NREL 46B-D3]
MSTGYQARRKTAPAPPVQGFPYRHAVITGASAGIGAAVALQLACLPGITLTLIGRHVARLAAVAVACRAQGAKVHALNVDVTNKAAMTDAVVQAHAECPVDLVLAIAGIVAAAPPVSISSSAGVASLADNLWIAAHTNIMGTLNTVAPALPLLKATAAAGRPAAVAVTSSVSVLPKDAVLFSGQLQVGLLPYAWTKQALLSLGQGLQGELAGSGVEVFTICPGVVLTGLSFGLAESFMGATGSKHADAAAAGGAGGAAAGVGLVDPDASSVHLTATAAGEVEVRRQSVLDERAAGAMGMMPEEALKQKLSAVTAEEAAAHICAGLAGGKESI